MRLKLLLASLLLLLPLPALADATARYSAGPDKILTIEVADGGNFRAEVADKVVLIRREGTDFLVVYDQSRQPRVTRLGPLAELIAAQAGSSHESLEAKRMDFELIRAREETVGGSAGTIWKFGPVDDPEGDKERDPKIDFVMSTDPTLAPIGGFFRSVFELVAPTFAALFGTGNFVQRGGELFEKGTPIRMGTLKLESLATGAIAASRFDLPGPEIEAMDFFGSLDPSSAATVPLPLP